MKKDTKKRIKFEKLSVEIKKEIQKYYDKIASDKDGLEIDDAMNLWFDKDFEPWFIKRFNEGENKRKSVRVYIEIPVKVIDVLIENQPDNDDESIDTIGTTVNISKGGLYFKSDKVYEKSSIVKVKIDLSDIDIDLDDIEALAMVIRVEKLTGGKFGIGLIFSSIYDETKENLDVFIFKNLAYYIYTE